MHVGAEAQCLQQSCVNKGGRDLEALSLANHVFENESP